MTEYSFSVLQENNTLSETYLYYRQLRVKGSDHAKLEHLDLLNTKIITANERQLWMNDVNNGYECLIIGAVVRSEYSTIRHLQLITGNVQKFVLSHNNGFQE